MERVLERPASRLAHTGPATHCLQHATVRRELGCLCLRSNGLHVKYSTPCATGWRACRPCPAPSGHVCELLIMRRGLRCRNVTSQLLAGVIDVVVNQGSEISINSIFVRAPAPHAPSSTRPSTGCMHTHSGWLSLQEHADAGALSHPADYVAVFTDGSCEGDFG